MFIATVKGFSESIAPKHEDLELELHCDPYYAKHACMHACMHAL